jgi:phosphatidylserine/phosphatidylglycerophosphate/cardiolipin synthase-like enzyme
LDVRTIKCWENISAVTSFREDNERVVAWLNERADTENLPLEARIADPGGRFEKIHAKGVIVDDEHVAVGSLNWNAAAFEDNREVVVLLHGSDVADYYGEVFSADWRGGIPRVTFGLLLALALVSLWAAAIGRLISFGAEHSEENRDSEEFDYTL